jgi:hypothetical protein
MRCIKTKDNRSIIGHTNIPERAIFCFYYWEIICSDKALRRQNRIRRSIIVLTDKGPNTYTILNCNANVPKMFKNVPK